MEESKKKSGRLEVTTEPVIVEIVSEPFVVLTFKGYAPVVEVKVHGDDLSQVMFIGSSSLSHGIEELRARNNSKFQGIKMRIRKESTEKFAKYIVEPVTKDVVIGEDLSDT